MATLSLIPVDTIVLYHRGCNDGLAAAWAASIVLPEGTQYIPYQYGEELPEMVYGKHLILVDLSLTPDQIQSIYPGHVASIMIIDHHKTAINKLGHLPAIYSYTNYLRARDQGGVYMLADSTRSGAVLAYGFFHNYLANEEWNLMVPTALRQVEDYDLWKFKMENTDEVNAWMINCASCVEDLTAAMDERGCFSPEVITLGKTLIDYDKKIVKSVTQGYIQHGTYQGKRYALINAPHHLRNRLSDSLFDKYDFVICYTRRRSKTVFSLRSNGSVDVEAIAAKFGGGGHATAAAFSIEHDARAKMAGNNPLGKPTLWQRLQLIRWAITTRTLI